MKLSETARRRLVWAIRIVLLVVGIALMLYGLSGIIAGIVGGMVWTLPMCSPCF